MDADTTIETIAAYFGEEKDVALELLRNASLVVQDALLIATRNGRVPFEDFFKAQRIAFQRHRRLRMPHTIERLREILVDASSIGSNELLPN